METNPLTAITTTPEDDGKTHHSKFMANQDEIRSRALADNNSYAATIVKSMDYFIMGRISMEKLRDTDINSCCHFRLMCQTLSEFATSFRASELFALFTLDLMADLKSVAKHLMDPEPESTSKVDQDARVCFTVVSKEDPRRAMEFLDASRKKYPTEAFFHKLYCDLFTFTGQLMEDGGFEAIEQVARLFPTHPDVLYSRAVLTRLTLDSGKCPSMELDSVKKAFLDFIAIAPKDHRFFADAHYTLAMLHLRANSPLLNLPQESLQQAFCHYQQGLEAEKNVLPCFLPFVNGAKNQVQSVINIVPTTYVYANCGPEDHLPPRQWSAANTTLIDCRVQKKNDRRVVKLIVAHRKKLKEFLSSSASANDNKMSLDNEDGTNNNNSSSKTKTASSSSGNTTEEEGQKRKMKKEEFCEIMLKDMIQAGVDKVYESKQITLTIVEDPVFNSSSRIIETLCGDRNADVISLQLCLEKDGKDEKEENVKNILKKFRFGSEWIMPQPQFFIETIGDNNGQSIRVTDISSIRPARENQDKCRFCWKVLTPGQQCSRCRMAKYCGRDCQTQDWKMLKHSLICCEEYKQFLDE